jgi:hypothetical protein
MDHNQNTVFAHTADGMPALFPVFDTVEDHGQMWICEDVFREGEVQAMLGKVPALFILIPAVSHCSSCLVLTVNYNVLCIYNFE